MSGFAAWSLRRRFTLAAGAAVTLAMLLGGWGLTLAFENSVRARAASELRASLRILATNLRLSEGGLALAAQPPDPRFASPGGGLYWQIARRGARELSSRSLVSDTLPTISDDTLHRTVVGEARSPARSWLLLAERSIRLPGDDGTPIRITVAMEEEELIRLKEGFAEFAALSLGLLGLLLVGGLWAFVDFGLGPLRRLGEHVAELRMGRRDRLAAFYPRELEPLASEINDLLAARESELARAQARSADLAHALKTPLAVIAALTHDGALDEGERRSLIDVEIANLDRVLVREMARARAALRAAQSAHATALEPEIKRMARAFERIGASRHLRIEIVADATLKAAIDPTDLSEVLGNLMDNAAKWARGIVRVSARHAGDELELTVEDDGSGLPDGVDLSPERGRRLDESKAGTGFGLAIVKDIAEAYAGSMHFDRSGMGGLKVLIRLPAVRE